MFVCLFVNLAELLFLWRAPKILELFGVESVEVQPVKDVQDSFVVVFPAKLRNLVQKGDQSPVEAHVKSGTKQKKKKIKRRILIWSAGTNLVCNNN